MVSKKSFQLLIEMCWKYLFWIFILTKNFINKDNQKFENKNRCYVQSHTRFLLCSISHQIPCFVHSHTRFLLSSISHQIPVMFNLTPDSCYVQSHTRFLLCSISHQIPVMFILTPDSCYVHSHTRFLLCSISHQIPVSERKYLTLKVKNNNI